MSRAQPVIELLPCKSVYRVTLAEDGFEMTVHVGAEEQIPEKVDYLRKKIAEEARYAYLKGYDDI